MNADVGALLMSSVVWDNHACMPLRSQDVSFLPQLQRHRAAGFHAVMLNIGFADMSPEAHFEMVVSLRRWLSQRPHEYLLIRGTDDILAARESGRLAVGFDIEGANAIGDDLSRVGKFYELGVRWMLLAYNRNNRVGGGCQDVDQGLTDFGRELLAEMERVGMQVCLSHTGHRTAGDVLAEARRPVIFSHSNPSALKAHPRNIPDELIRGCAATGGVVCINGVGPFLGANDTTSATFARHVEYVARLVGPQHVGIGLDYVYDIQELIDYIETMRHTFPPDLGYDLVPSFVAPEQLTEIVGLLLEVGFSSTDLQGILGGNLLRVASEVWR